MCLGIPMQIQTIDGDLAVCEIDGVQREASLMLLADPVAVGDFVLIHAGFAISKLDEEDAQATIDLFRQILAQGGGVE
ncbi:HypC/HybG/HupF family hydrogenase formation chaperone [Geoalkalibacter halelectricus]|uniref:HypC/HybG/HupF family hydrogenase formation chaperone n=1 Tax=Geoalkalibacter halelectricus TaxID=2847045 RepID=A0ABY5ZLG9_9BACT|nr:HypC/HybG/HupF family hydrogenase formation chaperone [Geoalkalibacter halelectricus]MDO3377751.1 HypC/HybG/HupF family hydrogenase formation chaperone [Geoalkalibacter halelectricus]UWZ78655.1 HypC/HybG/HupF family hydrogenase formation chaperone [Geoalkalibacter halelectricus]